MTVSRRREGDSQFIFHHQRGDVLSEIREAPLCPDGEDVAVAFLRRDWHTEDELDQFGFTWTEIKSDPP